MTTRALIFGISGQDGAYLARLLVGKGYEVHGTSRDAEARSFRGLARVGVLDRVTLHSASILDFRNLLQLISSIRPDEIYNLAGQSSVGLSFSQPLETLESIAQGTFQILEVIRHLALPIRFYNAGSGECFGETQGGCATDEESAFRPRSPYAAAKAAAFWATANYRDAYGMYACSGILFNHESPLRPERFVTTKIIATARRIARGEATKLELGSLVVSRDWGYAPEYVEAMWRMLQQEAPQDFVIATGEPHTLQEWVEATFQHFGLDWRDHVITNPALLRPSEILFSCGNPERARLALGWTAKTKFAELIEKLAEEK